MRLPLDVRCRRGRHANAIADTGGHELPNLLRRVHDRLDHECRRRPLPDPLLVGGEAASRHPSCPSDGYLTPQAAKVPSGRCRTRQVAMQRRRGWPSRKPCPGMETSRDGSPVSCKGANQRETGPAPEERRRTSVLSGGSSERWLDSSGGPISGAGWTALAPPGKTVRDAGIRRRRSPAVHGDGVSTDPGSCASRFRASSLPALGGRDNLSL